MKTAATLSAIVALAQAHATFQQLWKNGQDLESSCARLPPSNSPVTDYSSKDMQCNASPAAAKGKCSFAAGDTVTIEMHQHNDRDCKTEGIGGAHWGPVLAYMSKVDDASSADGSGEFFKVYENGWKKAPGSTQGDSDFWGTKDLNYNCGKLSFKIPTTVAAGDYLLRAEAIALHAASSSGGAQHYMTCYQLTVTSSGTVVPKGVKFPGAYTATGPGLGFSIHTNMDSYPMPGPALIDGGSEAVPQLLTFGTISGSPSPVSGSKPASSAAAAPASSAAPAGSSSAAVVPASSSAARVSATPVAASVSSAKVEAASSAAPSKTSAMPPTSVTPEPEESDCPAEEEPEEPEPEESDCPADEPEEPVATPAPSTPQPSSGAPAPAPAPSNDYPAVPTPTTMATSVRPAPTGASSVSIKEWAQCGGQGFTQGGQCAQGLECKQWNPYYYQCIKSQGGSQPSNSQPGGSQSGGSQSGGSQSGGSQPGNSQPNQPAPSQAPSNPSNPATGTSQPGQVVPEKNEPSTPAEKTYTLKTFIAWLEENAGSASAEKIRRMIEALQ